ncbi:MAG TPA: HDOD domain-containing protein [Solirubrobacteraceae bacterium]|nr:HDOD domain-containing protein [Solirubrobacteraceae bacterium]
MHQQARTPEERIHQERRELGVDHALVGGVLLLRRWGLSKSLATPIEHHHDRKFGGDAAFNEWRVGYRLIDADPCRWV